nr:hypothetical protein [Tanacetum cinerariifolium]
FALKKESGTRPNAQKFTIISSGSLPIEQLSTGLASSLKSVSNALPKQTEALTTIDSFEAKNVYVPQWDITNNFKMDKLYHRYNFVDHIPPVGY